MKEWYIAKCKAGKETWLLDSLAGLGLEVFYPRVPGTRRRRLVQEPLFPSYIFCHMDTNFLENPAIRWAPGLDYFLGTNGLPTCIPDALIRYLKENLALMKKGTPQDSRPDGHFPELAPVFGGGCGAKKRSRLLLKVIGRVAGEEPGPRVPAAAQTSIQPFSL